MKKFIIASFILIAVAGCQTTDLYEKGTGSIVLTQKVSTGFANYKLYEKPSYFAVANDGKGYGFTQCPHTSCSDDAGLRARESCDRGAAKRGSKCSIFAIGREIVWKGPVSFADRGADYLIAFAKIVGAGGATTNYAGDGRIVSDGQKISLKLGQCSGIADLATKKWSLTGCKNNYSAHGTFTEGSGTEKYYGHGTDSKNVNVEIKILVPERHAVATTSSKVSNPASKKEISESSVQSDSGSQSKSTELAAQTKKMLDESRYVVGSKPYSKETIMNIEIGNDAVNVNIERQSDYDHFSDKGVRTVTKRMYRNICNRTTLAKYLRSREILVNMDIFNQYKEHMINLPIDLKRCGDYGVNIDS